MVGFIVTGLVIIILGVLCFIKPMKVAYIIYSTYIPFQRIFGITGKWEENAEATRTSTRAGGVLMMVLGLAFLAFPVLAYLEKLGII